ncbi:MAG: YggU family protein [Betaproteobacteria bacterium]|nr:YggU family protein [Betaproteobacteria bacterium]
MSAWLRKDAQGWLLAIHAQPGAKRSEVAGLHGDSLKIRIAAPAVEGKANAALVAFVAEALGVPKRAVTVLKGEASREKLVRVADPSADPAGLLTQQS